MASVDPVRLRELGMAARTVSDGIDAQARDVKERVDALFLTELASAMNEITGEVVEELATFAVVAEQKAQDIEIAANGGTPANRDLTAAEFELLEASLNDGVGSKGLDGSEDPGLSPEGLEEWRKAHPNPSPDDLRKKMDEAAAAGNSAAMTYLSNVLWQTVDGLSADAATDYLDKLGPLSFMAAVESTGAPGTLPVSRYLAALAAGTIPPRGSAEMADYLKQRHGLNWTDSKQWGADGLHKMAHSGKAKTALQGIDWLVKQKGLPEFSPLAEAARQITLEYPDALAHIVHGPDRDWAQRLLDLMVVGSNGTDPESERIKRMLLAIQESLLDYGDATFTPEESALIFAQYILLLQATGHRPGVDLRELIKIILKGLDKKFTKGLLALLIDLGALEITDEVQEGRDAQTRQNNSQYDAAYLVLLQRNPEYAMTIAGMLGDPPNWANLPTNTEIMPDEEPGDRDKKRAVEEFYKIRDAMGPEFPKLPEPER